MLKSLYNRRLNVTKFVIFGYIVSIEYRPRLKTFDLVFYPNQFKRYGKAKFIGEVKLRNADFTELVALLIKTVDKYNECKSHDFAVLLQTEMRNAAFNSFDSAYYRS